MADGLLEVLPHTKLGPEETMTLHRMDILAMEVGTKCCHILTSPEMKLFSQCSYG
jgi:hypothetical protein